MKIGVLSVFAMLLIFGFAGFVVENDSVNADDSMFVLVLLFCISAAM